MGCRRAEQGGVLSGPRQVPLSAGQTRRLHWVCGWGRAHICPPLPPEVVFGRGTHQKLTTHSLELFKDFLEGRSTPPTGVE